MAPLTFKEWLRSEALALGFAKVGFASCEPFTEKRQRLAQWFQGGGATHLPYLDPHNMMDPARVMPAAQTALVGFFPYARPQAIPGKTPGSLKVSRYVWGPDYHGLLKVRLARLLEAAQAVHPGLQGRACVDTAPLLERQLAARAGLGWQGKHTLLIAGKAGSWGFLGVLLLSEELPPDEPFGKVIGADLRREAGGGSGRDAEEAKRPGGPPRRIMQHCGSCTACLDICPTAALTPFRLDPNRCLTTWTIETEQAPPPEIAAALRDTRWAAGCDACQEVCPWNRTPVWGDPALWGGASPLHTQPGSTLLLGSSQWGKLTRGSALRRVRSRHWRATVSLILGLPPPATPP